MRKFCLIALTVLYFYSSSSGQETMAKITQTYFRSDPFNKDFSAFVAHLINDPTLTNKILEKKTDSTLFYFQGTYTTFNPFFFKPKRIQVVLNEVALNKDSLINDTIYNYQLFAYDNASKEDIQEVKKEFDKIYTRYKNRFSSNKATEGTAGNVSEGNTYNFFDALYAVAPFALSWFGPNEDKEMCLVLTVRLDTYMNRAVLPAPF